MQNGNFAEKSYGTYTVRQSYSFAKSRLGQCRLSLHSNIVLTGLLKYL